MGALVAHVVHLERSVPGELTLRRQRPLLDIRISRLLRDDYGEELAAVDRRTDLVERHRRKHVVRQLGQGGIRCGVRRGAHNEGIDVARVVDFASLGGVKEKAVTAANHGLVSKPVSKAYAGGKWFLRSIRGIMAPAIVVETIAGRTDRSPQR